MNESVCTRRHLRQSKEVHGVGGVFSVEKMKRLILIFVLCMLHLPGAYGDTNGLFG
jgi:hypothetical protein